MSMSMSMRVRGWRAIVTAALALMCGGVSSVAFAQERIAPARGPERAASEVEVFLDFTSEPSGRLAVVLEALATRHPGDVRIVFRHLAPENDPIAVLPHRAAVAAERQGRFWDLERLLFANQDRRSREDLIGMAVQLQLDVEAFTRDLDDPTIDVVIDSDRARARLLKVASTPAVFVNGKPMAGERTLKHLESVIAAARITP
jgi:protein-disulfide isomerase